MGETLRLMINLCSAGGLPAVVPVVQRDTAPLQVLSSRFAQSLCGLVQPQERAAVSRLTPGCLQKPGMQVAQMLQMHPISCAARLLQAQGQIMQIQFLLEHRTGAACQTPGQTVQLLGPCIHLALHALAQPQKAAQSLFPSIWPGQGGQLGRRRGSGGAHIGTEIGNGEIGFMSDADHDRDRALYDGVRQLRVIEGPEVVDGAAATHQQDGVKHWQAHGVGCPGLLCGNKDIQSLQCGRQCGRSAHALHRRRNQQYRYVWNAAAQSCGHVVQCSGSQGSDQSQATGKGGECALACRIKQTLRFEFSLDAQIRFIQFALSRAAQAFHHQLQIATRFIDGQTPQGFDPVAFAGLPAEQTGCTAEHDAAQLALCILEGEIAMPAGSADKSCNLSLYPQGAKAGLQRVGHRMTQGSDRPDPWHNAGRSRVDRKRTCICVRLHVFPWRYHRLSTDWQMYRIDHANHVRCRIPWCNLLIYMEYLFA